MKHREPPPPTTDRAARVAVHQDRVARAARHLALHADARVCDGLDEAGFVVAQMHAHERRSVKSPGGTRFQTGRFLQAMNDTRQVVAMPEVDDYAGALVNEVLRLPEVADFWREWDASLPRGRRGPRANYAHGMALMIYSAACRISPQAKTNYHAFSRDVEAQAAFVRLAGGHTDGAPAGPSEPNKLHLSHEDAINRTINKLVDDIDPTLGVPRAVPMALAVVVSTLKEIKRDHPQVGRYFYLDGTFTKTWSKQAAGRDEDEEQRLRQASDDGYAARSQTRRGKTDVQASDNAITVLKTGKSGRGWHDVVLTEGVTGLKVSFRVFAYNTGEASGLIPVLEMLYALWPELAEERHVYLVADSGWDYARWCYLCEVNYGISPVFRRRSSADHAMPTDKPYSVILRDGQVRCSKHNKPMRYSGFERPGRDGLKPGQAVRAGKGVDPAKAEQTRANSFRVRMVCDSGPIPCGRVSIMASNDWRRLTELPHADSGRPELYALRAALLARLNNRENTMSWLREAKIVDNGSARGRSQSKARFETLQALSFMCAAGLMLADYRRTRDSAPNER